jgi:anaerobic selenocysteine-containing dehydrogenase
MLAARLGFTDEVFRLDDHALMELALEGSPASAAGVTADRLRADGFARVGAPVGDSPETGATFAFSCDRLVKAGLHPVAAYWPPAAQPRVDGVDGLRLLTRKRHYSINSSYGHLPVLLNAEPEAACEINPADAAARGIEDGASVRIHNELGQMLCRASVTDSVPPGTVAVPFGRWRNDPSSGGANSLTSDRLGDLANGPTFCDNLVEVALT